MSVLHGQLTATLPRGWCVPHPLAELYLWIERRGQYRDRHDGTRIGFLSPLEPADEDDAGTWLEFYAQGFPDGYQFGSNTCAAADRLRVFAQTGSDGSMAALWLDDGGTTRIVHLGSGSGSTMLCVLAEDALDFLRLCAIGYEELCGGDEASGSPPVLVDEASLIARNTPFRTWLEETFSTTVPVTGSEIVRHPDASMHSSQSEDPFWAWCMA